VRLVARARKVKDGGAIDSLSQAAATSAGLFLLEFESFYVATLIGKTSQADSYYLACLSRSATLPEGSWMRGLRPVPGTGREPRMAAALVPASDRVLTACSLGAAGACENSRRQQRSRRMRERFGSCVYRGRTRAHESTGSSALRTLAADAHRVARSD